MTPSTSNRAVWGTGLLVYLVGALFCILVPVWIPFIGAVVMLACVSAVGTKRDDPVVMSAVVTEVIVGAILAARLFGAPPWLDPVLIVFFPLASLIPIVVIGYRLMRPWSSDTDRPECLAELRPRPSTDPPATAPSP